MKVLEAIDRIDVRKLRGKPDAAASQRIVKAEAILVSIPFESGGVPPWSFGGSPKLQFDTLLVRLETEQGIVGWGEAFSHKKQGLVAGVRPNKEEQWSQHSTS